jgi:hypothetical protein
MVVDASVGYLHATRCSFRRRYTWGFGATWSRGPCLRSANRQSAHGARCGRECVSPVRRHDARGLERDRAGRRWCLCDVRRLHARWGCLVNDAAGTIAAGLYWPCHGSVFDGEGAATRGPSPYALEHYTVTNRCGRQHHRRWQPTSYGKYAHARNVDRGLRR